MDLLAVVIILLLHNFTVTRRPVGVLVLFAENRPSVGVLAQVIALLGVRRYHCLLLVMRRHRALTDRHLVVGCR